jgi:hypothetical protein
MGDLLELIPIELLDILFSYVYEPPWYLYKQYPLLLTDVDWAQAHFPEVLKEYFYWDKMIQIMERKYEIPNFENNIYCEMLTQLTYELYRVNDKVNCYKKIFKLFTSDLNFKYRREDANSLIIHITPEQVLKILVPINPHVIYRFIKIYIPTNLYLKFEVIGGETGDITVELSDNTHSIFLNKANKGLSARIFLELMLMRYKIN